MADSKITALTALTSADPANDMIPIVDVSDTPPASGNTKRISINNILAASGTATLASATITGAATVGTTLGVTGVSTLASAVVTGDLTVDTSTLKVDSTNNRVGIATATPGCRVDIVSDSNTSLAPVLRVNSNNVAVSTSLAYDGLIGSSTLTIQSGTSSPIVFNTNGANESGRINTTGVYVLKGGTTTANGVGVAFPSTQVASSDANCLDDYEEGTWTPVVTAVTGSLTTVTGQTGTYTKIGRMVTATGFFTITTNGTGSSAVALAGLPFANGGLANIGVGRVDGTTGNMFQVKINASASTANIWKYDNTYPAADGAQFPMTLVYYV